MLQLEWTMVNCLMPTKWLQGMPGPPRIDCQMGRQLELLWKTIKDDSGPQHQLTDIEDVLNLSAHPSMDSLPMLVSRMKQCRPSAWFDG